MFTSRSSAPLGSYYHHNRRDQVTNVDLHHVPRAQTRGLFDSVDCHFPGRLRFSDESSTRSLSPALDPIFDTGSSTAISDTWKSPTTSSNETKTGRRASLTERRQASIHSDTTVESSHCTYTGRLPPVDSPAHDTPWRLSGLRGEDTSAHDREDALAPESCAEPEVESPSKKLIQTLEEMSVSFGDERSAAPVRPGLDALDNTDLIAIDATSVKDDFWAWDQDRQRFVHTDKDTQEEIICPESFD